MYFLVVPVRIQMKNTQTQCPIELMKKITFYGQPVPDPCFFSQSSASRESTSMGSTMNFNFAVAGLERQDRIEGRESHSRHSQPLVVPPSQHVEPTFSTPRSGRLSSTQRKGSNQKKG